MCICSRHSCRHLSTAHWSDSGRIPITFVAVALDRIPTAVDRMPVIDDDMRSHRGGRCLEVTSGGRWAC